jgi:hypothetical protein
MEAQVLYDFAAKANLANPLSILGMRVSWSSFDFRTGDTLARQWQMNSRVRRQTVRSKH